MKLPALFAILMLFAMSSKADTTYVYQDSGVSMKFMSEPCNDPRVMQMIISGMPSHVERFKAIQSNWKMKNGTWKTFNGCWAELTKDEVGFEAVAMIFEDGDYFVVNKADFFKKKKVGTEV